MTGIFKAYDIRGRYPEELDESTASTIGTAFSRLRGAGTIIVGHDMRLSSSSLSDAFIEGCVAGGSRVTDLGMISTPMLYWAIIREKSDGGAMITASHLPGEMNGIKLCREDAIPLSGDEGLPAPERLMVMKIISMAIQGAKKNNRHSGLCGQAPGDYPEFAEFLTREGIDTISLNPDSVMKTTLGVLKVEKALKR